MKSIEVYKGYSIFEAEGQWAAAGFSFQVDISKVFTERGIDMLSINTRTSKQGIATVNLTFDVGGVEELKSLFEKIRQIDNVMEIERSAG